MYTYVCIYIYTYIHIYIYTYIHTYIHTLHYITLHTYIYIHIHVYMFYHDYQTWGANWPKFKESHHPISGRSKSAASPPACLMSLTTASSGWIQRSRHDHHCLWAVQDEQNISFIYIYIYLYMCIYICVYIYIEYINMCIHNWNRQPVLLRSGHAGWNPAPKGDRQRSTPLWLKPRISISTLIFRSDLPPHKNPEMSLDHGFPPKKKCQKRFLHRNSLPQSPLIKAPSWSENQVTAAELELPLPVVLLPRSFTTTWWRLPRLPQ